MELADGRRDLLISNDSGEVVSVRGQETSTDAALCLVRRDSDGRPAMMAICKGQRLEMKDVKLQLAANAAFVQVRLTADGAAAVVAGNPKEIERLEVNGRLIAVQPGFQSALWIATADRCGSL